MVYTGKDGNLYPRRIFFSAISVDPDKDKDDLVNLAEQWADLINQHPERPLSQFPESNKVFVDKDNCLMVIEKLSDICGFSGTIRVIGLFHPRIVIDRKFGKEQPYIMTKFFRKGSMSVTEVRHIGASGYYASAEALAELRDGAKRKAAASTTK